MPLSPLRPCAEPGCPELVGGRQSRCALHERGLEAARRASRGTAKARGYGRDWEALSRRYRALHPACVVCGAPATVVPLGAGGARLDPANLQALCHSHHSTKTGRQRGA